MASRRLLKLYCPYLNCSNSAEIRFCFSINLFIWVQAAHVSSLMMPALSSPQIPQKYWDELSQPPSPKGEDKTLWQQLRFVVCLVNSSPKTLQNFLVFAPWWSCPTKHEKILSWSRGKLISWELISWHQVLLFTIATTCIQNLTVGRPPSNRSTSVCHGGACAVQGGVGKRQFTA